MPEQPVFVRGFSRSGGTLLVTVLDAHPDLAMSYEIYPHLLEGEGAFEDFTRALSKARKLKKAGKKVDRPQLRTFILRCDRGGLDIKDLRTIAKAHAADGRGFGTVEDRLAFMAACCRRKMNRTGATRWGLKCSNRYGEYLGVWPEAHFINITRDGRDVLASQLNTGNFKKTPAEVADGWTNTYRNFQALVRRPDANALQVRYEDLVTDPEPVLRRIADLLDLDFSPNMLSHNEHDLTIYEAAGHLSMDRIKQGIDTSRMGRWRRDLTAEQVDEFMAVAADTMAEAGYLEDKADAHRS